MAGIELGKAFVQIVPSAQGISGSMSKLLKGEAGNAGKTAGLNLGDQLKKYVKKAVAGLSIGAAIKQSLDFGSELEQNLGGTEVVFGKFAGQIQDEAKNAYKNMGLSASEYMATANKMGSLFKGSGMEQERAMELSTSAMQRAADVASVMGLDTSAAMEAIAGAAKNNFTMMDNLGVKMDATSISAYALEKGINFEWNTASEAQKAEVAMQMFMDRTSDAAGNFARESEGTFSGSIGAMKAAYQDFLANLMLGEDVVPAFENLVSTATTFLVNNFLPAIGRIISSIPSLLGASSGMMDSFAEGISSSIPNLVSKGLDAITSFLGSLITNAGDFIAAGGNLISNLITGYYNALPVFYSKLPELIKTLVNGIATALPQIVSAGVNIVKSLWEGIKSLGTWLSENWTQIASDMWDAISSVDWLGLGSTLITTIWEGISSIAGEIPGVLRQIGETAWQKFKEIDWKGVGKAVIDFIGNGIEYVKENAPRKIKEIGEKAWKWFKDVDWLQLGKDVITFIVDGLVAFITKIPEKLKEIGETAIKKVTEIDWLQLGKDIINGIISGVSALGSSLWQKLKSVATGAKDEAESVDFSESGKNWMNGLISGIDSKIDLLKKRAKSAAQQAHQEMKIEMGEQSPAKKFIQSGRHWMEGLAIGINRNVGLVTDAMSNVSGLAYNGLSSMAVDTMSGVRTMPGNIGGSTVININTTVDGAENPEDFASRLVRQLQLDMRAI